LRTLLTPLSALQGTVHWPVEPKHVVNYHDEDAADQIRRVAPAGVDLIVEVAAGPTPSGTSQCSSPAAQSPSTPTTVRSRSP
jgi:hypothetical protein